MDIVLSTEKGYSLLEMLICLMMVSSFSMLSLRLSRLRQPDCYYFLNECMLEQSEAMKLRSDRVFKEGIRFNSMGHINMARTVQFYEKKITLNLGNGYALVK